MNYEDIQNLPKILIVKEVQICENGHHIANLHWLTRTERKTVTEGARGEDKRNSSAESTENVSMYLRICFER